MKEEEPEIITVTDVGNGYIHQYHVAGNVCVNCQRLLGGSDGYQCANPTESEEAVGA